MTRPDPAPLPGLDLTPPLALAVVLACIALGIFAVRMHQLRQVRRSRRRVGWFMSRCEALLRGEITDAELRRDTAGTPEGEFWTALERLSLRWRRHEWRRLSRALAHASAVTDERRALRDDSPWRRVLATRRLALVRSRAGRSALRRALVRGPELVTHAAALALARYRDIAALRWLLAHPGRIARRPRLALQALLRGFGPRGRAELVAALERGIDDAWVERATMESLGLLGEATARAALERRLGSADVNVRVAAVRALGRIRAIESGTLMLAALRDPEWPVRAHAARALGRARVALATEALAARLTDPVWWVRHHAAYALAELGDEGRAMLRAVAATSPDPYARDIAREALAGGPRLDAA
jgi:hypothetical protein